MFWEASENNIDISDDSVSEFIRKGIGDVVPTVTIKTYPNQKSWIDGGIRANLNTRCQYRDKVESQFNGSDTICMWQSLQTIMDYKRNTNHVTDIVVLLPDKQNTFFARFEDNTVPPTSPSTKDCGLSFSVADVSKTFKSVNTRKGAGPDGIPSRVLRACSDQLADVFMDIFNLSLSQSAVPTWFKMATIVPVPKNAKVTELNDYRPVALTSVIMKCFERLVKDHITSTFPVTLDTCQFVYRPNRSTDDAIAITLPYSIWTRGIPM